MALTPEQLVVLKNDILADPVLSAKPLNYDAAYDIAAAYNVEVSPAFVVWKTNVSIDEIMRNGMD
jgi:hypothetical protein